MRQRARVDANQVEICKALRSIGCVVLPIHQLGGGAPDLLVSRRGVNLLMELKDGEAPLSQQALTPAEQRFRDTWRGHYAVIHSIEEAIDEVRRNT